jgi:DNA-binding response OmpR family regulator
MARILIIDDDDQFRGMLRQTLAREGHEVIEARDGGDGVACYRAAPADLVITDILMPEHEGLETIKQLRAEFPAVKIIAISGGGAKGTFNFLKPARLLGAQRTLVKPFDLEELRLAIREVLS